MPGEFDLIAKYFAPLAANAPLAFGLTDDAAVLRPEPGQDIVVTTDCMVGGIHFLPADGPQAIAQKLLRVNLSDLAAKGAVPLGYVLALAMPKPSEADWLASFAAGLALDQAAFGINLLGGDTVSTPGPLTLTITAFGTVPQGTIIRRSGARAGDDVYVSGTIGDAALGLAQKLGRLDLPREAAGELLERLHRPVPRLELGQGLRGLATAGLDVSDGLIQDIGHIATTSGLACIVEAELVPRSSAAAQAGAGWLATRLTGGDDYELVFTAPPDRRALLEALAVRLGVPVTRIGQMAAGSGVTVRQADGSGLVLPEGGYQHF